jgi:predicted HNH restriction endonuclease
VNVGKKDEKTGIVACGTLAEVGEGEVSVRIDRKTTQRLMKHPIPLEEVRRVIPKHQNNLGDVTEFRERIEQWINVAPVTPRWVDELKDIADAAIADMGFGPEGRRVARFHMEAERSDTNRKIVLRRQTPPYRCEACNDTLKKYGRDYGELIHVHHLKPLSSTRRVRTPKAGDFAILCPNCHAVAHWHRTKKPLSVEEIKKRLNEG